MKARYYFVCLAYREHGTTYWQYESITIDKHPLSYLMDCRDNLDDRETVMVNYQEISKVEYNTFKE